MATTILEAAADGSSDGLYRGGPCRSYLLTVGGTFDGATVTLEVSRDDGATWTSTSVTFTTADTQEVNLPDRCKIRLTISGEGAMTSIDASI